MNQSKLWPEKTMKQSQFELFSDTKKNIFSTDLVPPSLKVNELSIWLVGSCWVYLDHFSLLFVLLTLQASYHIFLFLTDHWFKIVYLRNRDFSVLIINWVRSIKREPTFETMAIVHLKFRFWSSNKWVSSSYYNSVSIKLKKYIFWKENFINTQVRYG